MADYLFTNHATSRLRIATDATSPTITLPTGDGNMFPQPAGDGSNQFAISIDDRRTGQLEICICDSRNGDILHVLRGQEGTTAQNFIVGAVVSNRLTAGTLQYFQYLLTQAGGYTKPEADARFVNTAGDVMTGNLSVPPPAIDAHATTKYYVDGGLATKSALGHVHPISDVTNLQATLDGKMPVATAGGPYGAVNNTWVDLSTSFTVSWNNISGKPATFPPTLPIPTAGVTGLDTKQTAQDNSIAANAASITQLSTEKMGSAPTGTWGANGTAWVNLDPMFAAKIGEAPTDGFQYARQSSSWSKVAGGAYIGDVPPSNPLPGTLWWESDTGYLLLNYADINSTQWVMINAVGMAEANIDGKAYARKDGAWFDLTASFASKADLSYVNTQLANYLPLTGGTLAGPGNLTVNGNATIQGSLVVDGLGTPYAIQSNPSAAGAGGGIIGFGSTGSIYAISGYGGNSIYTSGPHSFNGDVQMTGAMVLSGLLTSTAGGSDVQTSTANTVMTTNGTLRRTTSSLAYKTDIEELWDDRADKVLELRPIYYRPKGTSDPEGYTRYGFGAEHCYAVDPRFSTCEPRTLVGYERIKEQAPNPDWGDWQAKKEGDEPPVTIEIEKQGPPIYEDRIDIIGLDLNAIVAALQQVIKRQDARIAALEAARGV